MHRVPNGECALMPRIARLLQKDRAVHPLDIAPANGIARALRARWRGEDVVSSDASPDDMRLAGHAFGSVAEGGAAIVVPGHLKYVRVGFHAFDPQTRAERPVRGHQVRHEG